MSFRTITMVVLIVLLPAGDIAGQELKVTTKIREQQLSSGPGQSRTTFNFARSIAADESGRVHAVWHTTQDERSQVYYGRSVNNGDTWDNSTQLSSDDTSNEHPSIAISGDNVFVAWQSIDKEKKHHVYLRQSIDGGRRWKEAELICSSGAAAQASVATTGSLVHLIWGDARSGETAVYYRRSLDRGRTWERERQLTDSPATSYVPSLAASGKVIVLAWVDTRDGNEEEYVKISTDGGLTWGTDTRITDNRMNSWAPSVAVEGETIHLAWFDQKDTPFHLYDAEAKLDEALRMVGLKPESPPPGVHIPHPEMTAKFRATEKMKKISAEAPSWRATATNRAKLQAILREFHEMGQPLELLTKAEETIDMALALIAINMDTLQKPDISSVETTRQRIQAKAQEVHQRAPGWIQAGGNPEKLHALMEQFQQIMKRAQQNGSYTNKERRLDEALRLMNIWFEPVLPDRAGMGFYSDVMQHRIQTKHAQLKAAAPRWVQQGGDPKRLEGLLQEFESRMKIASFEWDIYYCRSDDAGKRWTNMQRLVAVPGNSHRPNLTASDGELHLVWWDNRNGNNEIYYKHSADSGQTWSSDISLTNTPGESRFPMITITASNLHIVFTEQHDGHSQVHYKRFQAGQ